MTRPRLSVETWAAARRDYEAGASTRTLARHYGLNERSVRRRASVENWRRADGPRGLHDRLRESLAADHEALPSLNEIDQMNGEDTYDLLFLPDPAALCGFAFRKAAECAALGSPGEASAWLRVVRLADHVSSRRDLAVRPYSDADYARAEMMHVHTPAWMRDALVDSESDMPVMPAENHGGPDSEG